MYKCGGIGSPDNDVENCFHTSKIPKYKQDICSICNNLPHGEKEVKCAHYFQFRLFGQPHYLEIPNQKILYPFRNKDKTLWG